MFPTQVFFMADYKAKKFRNALSPGGFFLWTPSDWSTHRFEHRYKLIGSKFIRSIGLGKPYKKKVWWVVIWTFWIWVCCIVWIQFRVVFLLWLLVLFYVGCCWLSCCHFWDHWWWVLVCLLVVSGCLFWSLWFSY